MLGSQAEHTSVLLSSIRLSTLTATVCNSCRLTDLITDNQSSIRSRGRLLIADEFQHSHALASLLALGLHEHVQTIYVPSQHRHLETAGTKAEIPSRIFPYRALRMYLLVWWVLELARAHVAVPATRRAGVILEDLHVHQDRPECAGSTPTATRMQRRRHKNRQARVRRAKTAGMHSRPCHY